MLAVYACVPSICTYTLYSYLVSGGRVRLIEGRFFSALFWIFTNIIIIIVHSIYICLSYVDDAMNLNLRIDKMHLFFSHRKEFCMWWPKRNVNNIYSLPLYRALLCDRLMRLHTITFMYVQYWNVHSAYAICKHMPFSSPHGSYVGTQKRKI